MHNPGSGDTEIIILVELSVVIITICMYSDFL